MGKLEGKVAVITGGSSGMALASAKRFVEEGAYVFITGRKQETLDEAVRLIGRNVTGVRGDAANLDDLNRLFDTVKREKGKIDILYASAGMGEAVPLGEITEQHFDATFGLNARGTPTRRSQCSETDNPAPLKAGESISTRIGEVL
jgi:NAD(P)-dependent dehydrogenase (short-subunit alcohol dehydrogenase family)